MSYNSFHKRCGRELALDWPVHLATLISLLIAYVATSLHDVRYTPFLYIWMAANIFACLLVVYILCSIFIRAICFDPAHPFKSLPIGFLRTFSPRFFATLVFVCELPLIAAAFTTFKFLLPELGSYHNDVFLADIDQKLHGQDPWLLLQHILGYPAVTRLLEGVYGLTWFVATVFTPVFVSLLMNSRQLRLQYILTLILTWFVLGNLLALIFLSGGPCFYGEFTGDNNRFAYINTYLANLGPRAFAAQDVQHMLLVMFHSHRPEIGSGISAFPSLHVATAMIACCLLCSFKTIWTRIAGVTYVLLVMIGSIHLGWHYAVDGYFSIIAVILLWKACGKFLTANLKHQ